jgi:hypothetical protein
LVKRIRIGMCFGRAESLIVVISCSFDSLNRSGSVPSMNQINESVPTK